jgi:hypothetical protein
MLCVRGVADCLDLQVRGNLVGAERMYRRVLVVDAW